MKRVLVLVVAVLTVGIPAFASPPNAAAAVVPEPSGIVALSTGVVGLCGLIMRRRK